MEPTPGQHLGANIDTRPPEEAATQDVTAAETIAVAAPVNWTEQDPASIRTFGVQDQSGKSDCVAETRRKVKRVMMKVNHNLDIDFSSVALYRKRSNFPGQGMIAADVIQLDATQGMTLDVLVPSDVLTTEAEANALAVDPVLDAVGKAFATSQNDVIFTPGDLETIAGTIQKTRKAAMIWFFATVEEWSMYVPEIRTALTGPGDSRSVVVHSVTAIEPALYQGRKGFWIDDSAHFGGLSRRFITEEFFRARNWFASYPIAFKFEAPTPDTKPHHTFSRDLEFSATFNIDTDVIALQDIMKYEGVFPTNVDSTGYFGALTFAAVKKLQDKHGIAGAQGAGYGRVGPNTRAYLNATYGA